jgi:hypothetical protein
MEVDEAGHNIEPARVNRLVSLVRLEIADFGYLAVLDPDIGAVTRHPGAIDHHATSDDYIEFGHLISSSLMNG